MSKAIVAGLMAIAVTLGAQAASAAPFEGRVDYAGNWSLPDAAGFDDNTHLTFLNAFVLDADGSFNAAGMLLPDPLVHASPLTYGPPPILPAGPLWFHVASGIAFTLTSMFVESVDDFQVEIRGEGYFTGAGNDQTSGEWALSAQRANRTITTAPYEAYARVSTVPVPEPATLALLGFGLVGVGATRRRSRR